MVVILRIRADYAVIEDTRLRREPFYVVSMKFYSNDPHLRRDSDFSMIDITSSES